MTTAMIAIKERPVIFSGAMVRALIDGKKSQTRRVLRVQPPDDVTEVFNWQDSRIPKAQKADEGCYYTKRTWPEHQGLFFLSKCPYGQPGERLWVRESIHIDDYQYSEREPLPNAKPADIDDESIYYRADGECCQQIPECACAEVGKTKWRSPILMPPWASRITLEITDVQVERVQDISEDDAKAEGVTPASDLSAREFLNGSPVQSAGKNGIRNAPYSLAYMRLWNNINAKRGYPWAANPFVWVITFRRV